MSNCGPCCWGCGGCGCDYGSPVQGQPVSSSGAAIDAAGAATTGTGDTINSLITGGISALTAVVTGKAKQQAAATAVKAQVQIAQANSSMYMWIGIAVLAAVGFAIAFGGFKRR